MYVLIEVWVSQRTPVSCDMIVAASGRSDIGLNRKIMDGSHDLSEYIRVDVPDSSVNAETNGTRSN